MAQAIHECSATDKKVPNVTNVMAIVMAGMTKVFVGEITAEARRIMEKNGETGPIRPRHLREAHRKYYKRRPLARGRNMRRLFR
ncbi:Transcription initiation factor TFIID subunit 11 [Phytophthora citrophthora]|uniref:Transcription initiation factor TFIID subunit 11 n=1 Tax=Phytophthora citrophthora TaxID=4793 RepID=A0AAD9LSQ1_9STRA|nr:Transcription initiation factor TFIID subunit 11 [Phytophthora citrophthora]